MTNTTADQRRKAEEFLALHTADQRRKAEEFLALHTADRPFVVANPWDAGTARVLTGLGFAALATTGAGFSHSLGRPDGHVTREEILDNAAAIVDATHLPVSANLESSFGETPENVAETIRLAARAGLVGGSVEDSTGRADDPLRPLEEAVERVAAAVAAARELDFPFTVTARAENFFQGRPEPARHHPPPAGVRGGGRRRPVRAGAARRGRRTGCVHVGRPPSQRAHGRRPATVRRGARKAGRAPRQRRLSDVPRRVRRPRARRRGDP